MADLYNRMLWLEKMKKDAIAEVIDHLDKFLK